MEQTGSEPSGLAWRPVTAQRRGQVFEVLVFLGIDMEGYADRISWEMQPSLCARASWSSSEVTAASRAPIRAVWSTTQNWKEASDWLMLEQIRSFLYVRGQRKCDIPRYVYKLSSVLPVHATIFSEERRREKAVISVALLSQGAPQCAETSRKHGAQQAANRQRHKAYGKPKWVAGGRAASTGISLGAVQLGKCRGPSLYLRRRALRGPFEVPLLSWVLVPASTHRSWLVSRLATALSQSPTVLELFEPSIPASQHQVIASLHLPRR